MTQTNLPSATAIQERIYSGYLGKAIGVRLGAPVEPTIWTYQRIRDTYGDITGYLRDFTNFAADDDTNGPVYFIRAMRDYSLEPTAEQVGKTWLNYAADGHGMYWWGGYGISTEHTGYANLRAGIPAPRSGSIGQNGASVAEQIGGQIFIDSWGWVNPNNPERAAKMAATAASVAHDGEGLNGARFVAATIAAAFGEKTVAELFETGLSVMAPDSEYARVVKAVLAFHQTSPDHWRDCREMLASEFGYDRYPGICHIIPNAGVLALAMIYGQGDLPKTVEIATMCGWDTDCNAGNAGAIIGTLQGGQRAWDKYRTPINDTVIASGVTGSLNIVDVPTFARELATLALQLAGEKVPPGWKAGLTRRGLRFDFSLPGATHGFRAAGSNKIKVRPADPNSTEPGALEILLDRLTRGESGRVFFKPFYRRADFNDERYRPMFSPLVASGQTVRFKLRMAPPFAGDGHLRIVPYVRGAMDKTIREIGGWIQPEIKTRTAIEFVVPECNGEAIDEVGFCVEYFGREKFLGSLFLSDFEVSGPGHTKIDPAKEAEEWGAITRFTHNRGNWKLEGGRIVGHTATDADLWTGHLYARDLAVRASVIPHAGTSHLLTARAQGTSRFYAAGFEGDRLMIVRHDFGDQVLAEVSFVPEKDREYEMAFEVRGHRLTLLLDGRNMLETRDGRFEYGMGGLRMGSAGRLSVGRFEIEEF
jgi:ADP-ribosylglycohydrolase